MGRRRRRRWFSTTECSALVIGCVMVWVVWAEGQSAIKDDGVVVKRDVASHATPVGTARFAARHDAEYKVTHTGLWVSSVGVGTYIGEANDATDRMVTSAIVASARAGVNHVDTASNYRKGRGERAVGAALRELFAEGVSRDELVIATKAGFVVGDVAREARRYGATSADFDASGRHCVAPACIKASLDVSLERLGVSTVDILYLHNVCEKRTDLEAPQIASLLRTAFGHLEIERRNERIRYYGLATFSLTFRAPPGTRGGFRLATDVWPLLPVDHGFRFVQLPVTLDMPEAFAEKWEFRGGEPATLNATAAALGVDIVSSKSLGGRRRRRRGGWSEQCLESGSDGIYPTNDPGARALHVARSTPGLVTALVGHKTPAHVRANLAILATPALTPSQFRSLVDACTPS